MESKQIKIPNNKEKTTPTKIADFLATTGFILEMEVSEFLKEKGYKIQVNKYFYDYDENKKREIDIIATKKVNDIYVTFIIECKQTTTLDWIFVCSDKNPNRYYNTVKHLPGLPFNMGADKTKIFDHLRQLDCGLPLANNFIIRHLSGKPQDSGEIYECIKKLPKALVDVVYNMEDSKHVRHLFIPITVFSGQIFTAEYDNQLIVKDVGNVQYHTDLDSDAYKYHYQDYSSRYSFVLNGSEEENIKNSPVADISNSLGKRYLIEFVTKEKLGNFLSDTEDKISKINLSLWSITKKLEK